MDTVNLSITGKLKTALLWNHKWMVVTMLLLLLSRLSPVRLCVTPQTAAHQAPPSLGFSRPTLESVTISFSNAWKWKVKVKSLSHVWLFATPWTAAYQVPLSMGFSRQEYWSGVPLLSLGGHHKKFLIAFCQTKNLTLVNFFENDVKLNTSHTFYHTVIVWNQNAYVPTLTTFFFISLYHTAQPND